MGDVDAAPADVEDIKDVGEEDAEDMTEARKLQKFNIRGLLFLPKMAFLISKQSMKQNLLSVKYVVMFCYQFI